MLSLGLSKRYGKKDSEVSQFLKKIFRLSLLPATEVCDCFALEIFIQSSERQASGTVLRLPARKLYWCRLHFSSAVWSECTASPLRTVNACELFRAHFNAVFYSEHHKTFVSCLPYRCVGKISLLVTVKHNKYWVLITWCLIQVSQEEWTKLRESVPYVELYRYNPKHISKVQRLRT